MATTKKRINITLGKEKEKFLSVLAKGDRVPVATKAAELLNEMLEIEEDKIWDEIATRRDTKDAVYVSHEKAWSLNSKSDTKKKS